MSLQVVKNINVDFYDKKYILINAKQYDDVSRYISITCYDQGKNFNLSASKHSAYVRYRKADGKAVLNFCNINSKGEVLVELTEQMLAADGICYVDLIIINKGKAMVDIGTGEIVAIDDTPILSTMAFYVNVYESSVDNSVIESSYEYDGLNEALKKAEAEYTEVIQLSKSYAIGNAGGIRDGENTDNSPYYYEKSLESANKSAASEASANSYMNTTNTYMNTTKSHMDNAKSYMDSAKSHMDNAKTYMDNAKASETNALASEQKAKTSETNALESEQKAKTSETNSKISETNALSSEQKAKISETNAATSESNAKTSETNAKTSETNSKISETNAKTSEINAKTSETNALESESNAKASETNAATSESNAKTYMDNAKLYMDNAKVSETNAKTSETNALNNYNLSKSYAVGDTGVRDGEDEDNAKYYYELVKHVALVSATVDEVKEYLDI